MVSWPFELKNAKATYQRLVDNMFAPLNYWKEQETIRT